MMKLDEVTLSVPLREIDGQIRVGETRVTLDTVVHAFQDGATPEEIAQRYSSLMLADIYSVIGYYLQCRVSVDEYLAQRETLAAQVRQQNQATCDPQEIRSRLLARRASQKTIEL